jgi:hypothetical protein
MQPQRAFHYYNHQFDTGAAITPDEGFIFFRDNGAIELKTKALATVDVFLLGSFDPTAIYSLFDYIFVIDSTSLLLSPDKEFNFSTAPNLVATGLKDVYPLGREIYVAGDDGFHKAEVGVWTWTDVTDVLNITDLDFCAPNLLASTSDSGGVAFSTDFGSSWTFSTLPAGANGVSALSITSGKVYAVLKDTSPTIEGPRLLVSTDNGLTFNFLPNDNVTTSSTDFFGKVYEFESGRIVYATSEGIYTSPDDGEPFLLRISTAANGISRFQERLFISCGEDGIYYSDDEGVTFTQFSGDISLISSDDTVYVTSGIDENLIIDDANFNQFLRIEEESFVTFLTDDQGNILTDDSGLNNLTV